MFCCYCIGKTVYFFSPLPLSKSRLAVKTFVEKTARSVITDVAKLDVVSDGLLHNHLLNFCQDARMTFLGRNTPTPLLSEFMAQVNDTIVEVGMWIGLHIFANLRT